MVMEGLIILIVIAGIAIGAIGILIIMAFMWLQRQHKPFIPGSPPSSQLAFSIASSPRPYSDRSWDSVVHYSLEGGERDNQSFDRKAIQVATSVDVNDVGNEVQPTVHYRSQLSSRGTHSPSSDDGVADMHIYSSVGDTVGDYNDRAPEVPKKRMNGPMDAGRREFVTYVRNDNEMRPELRNYGGPVRGSRPALSREPDNYYNRNPQVRKERMNVPVDDHYQVPATIVGKGNYVRPAPTDHREPTNCRDTVLATSFRYATPVPVTPDGDLNETTRPYNAEGDISMASLSSIETEQSDASILLTPLGLSRPVTLSLAGRGTEEEVYI